MKRNTCGIAVGLIALASCARVQSDIGAVSDASGGGPGGSGSSDAGRTASSGAAGAPRATGGGESRPGAGGAAAGGARSDVEPSAVGLEGAPIYTRLQRLTNAQWTHAVTDILRLEAPPDVTGVLPPPASGVTEFLNNELVLYVDEAAAAGFELAAEAAARAATSSAAALTALYPGTDPEGFVRTLGLRAFRRPLTSAEEARYVAMFLRGNEIYGEDFANGAALVIRAMLNSPNFLYRSELGPAGEPLSGFEVASKLSFWLLGTTPSDALLTAAGAGALDSADGLEAAAREMLEQPAALEVMRDFHGQLYELDRYLSLKKEGVPGWTPALNPELSEASYRFFDDVFQSGGGLATILTSTRGFVGPGLAPFYGVQPAPSQLEERELGPERSGYFMQVPFSMLWALGEQPNSIARGVALLKQVLCASLSVPASTPPFMSRPPTGQTNRQQVTEFTASCAGACHKAYIDPLGFAFEELDGMGRLRGTDNGLPIDSSGSFPFEDGERSFQDAAELMHVLAEGTQAHVCYAKKMAGYALQRDIVAEDRPLLDSLAAVSHDASLKEVIIALVRDPAFRVRQGDASQ